MVVGNVKPERTPLEKEHSRQDRNAWFFALALIIGCSIPIAAAITLRAPATKRLDFEASMRSPTPLTVPIHASH